MRLIQICLLFFITNKIYCQIDYDKIKRQSIHPSIIDTVSNKVLVIKKRNATIYFNQSDLKEYCRTYNTLGVRTDLQHHNLLSVLDSAADKITITDYWSTYSDSDRMQLFQNINYSNMDKVILAEVYYVGADLIHDGKFMIIENRTSKRLTKGLKIQRVKGQFGTRYVEFRLPDKNVFWVIVTRHGE